MSDPFNGIRISRRPKTVEPIEVRGDGPPDEPVVFDRHRLDPGNAVGQMPDVLRRGLESGDLFGAIREDCERRRAEERRSWSTGWRYGVLVCAAWGIPILFLLVIASSR